MFDFSNGTTRSTVTQNFWVYWVVTIPLTLAILGIWKTWMVMENNRSESEAGKESLKQERNVEYKDVINANLAHNTPFYGGSGANNRIY